MFTNTNNILLELPVMLRVLLEEYTKAYGWMILQRECRFVQDFCIYVLYSLIRGNIIWIIRVSLWRNNNTIYGAIDLFNW